MGVRRLLVATTAAGAALGVGGAAVYLTVWRKPCLTWGASPEDVEGVMPGDELLAAPDLVTTRAVSINAPPSAVWPWLVQMGSGKGGIYTYDWIENLLGLDMHSVDVVLPEFQDRKVGDTEQLGAIGGVIGVLFISLVGNGFDLLGVNPLYQQITLGVILLLAVGVDAFSRSHR